MTRTRIVFAVSAAIIVTAGISAAAQSGKANTPKPAPSSKQASSPETPAKAADPVTSKATTPAQTTKSPAAAPSAAKPVKGTESIKATPAAKAVKPTDAVRPAKETTSAKVAAPPNATKSAEVAKPAKETKPVNATKETATNAAKTETPAAKKAPKEPSKAEVKASAPTPAATPATPLTTVQEKLQQNTHLAAKVASRLPAGTDLMAASEGFRDLGQFVAAVSVSHNLKLSFADLKTQMVTGRKSLGDAIPAVRPVASGTIEAQRAEHDARAMIAESERQPPVKATTAPPPATTIKAKAKKPVAPQTRSW